MQLLYKKQISSLITSYLQQGRVSVYVIGSLKESTSVRFHPELSDVDLLVVPECDSLSQYVSHFEQVIKLSHRLNKDEQLYDVFLMSSHVAEYHYSCLSVLAGANHALSNDRIFGPRLIDEDSEMSKLSVSFLKNLYAAYSIRFFRDLSLTTPISDTTRSRKAAKDILRCLKLLLCSVVAEKGLASLERGLSLVGDFTQILPFSSKELEINEDELRVLNTALSGEIVNDWAEWMKVQEAIMGKLGMLEKKIVTTVSSEGLRFNETIGVILRSMLILELKEIIVEDDERRRRMMMNAYIDKAIGLVTRLAIMNVSGLRDFETEETPLKVKDAYKIIHRYLKEDTHISNVHMAASIVLLEYAFQQSLPS